MSKYCPHFLNPKVHEAEITFTAAGDKILVEATEAGVNGEETLCQTLELTYEALARQIPQMYSLSIKLDHTDILPVNQI